MSIHFSAFHFSAVSLRLEVLKFTDSPLWAWLPFFTLAQPRYMYQILAANHLSSRLSGDGSSVPSTGSFVFCSLVQSVSHLHP